MPTYRKIALAFGTMTGALAVAAAIKTSAEPPRVLSQDEIIGAFAYSVFDLEEQAFDATVKVDSHGGLRVQSQIGAFDGRWQVIDDTLCIFFEEGPRTGATCSAVTQIGPRAYATDTGAVLRKRFDAVAE
ncbi:hypothetical protein [Pseudaestuariivita sp.]|uniref:hypothetical protein n=1 Tax=Pseudaestuariivita sp. TaxID=2211669 RepID=UPI0040585066